MPRKSTFTEMFDLHVTGVFRLTREEAAEAIARCLYKFAASNWATRGAQEKLRIMAQHLRSQGMLGELVTSLVHEKVMDLLRIMIPSDMGRNIASVGELDDINPSPEQHKTLLKYLLDNCDTELSTMYEVSQKEISQRKDQAAERRLLDALEVVRKSGKYTVLRVIEVPAEPSLYRQFKATAVKSGKINLVMGRTPNNEEL